MQQISVLADSIWCSFGGLGIRPYATAALPAVSVPTNRGPGTVGSYVHYIIVVDFIGIEESVHYFTWLCPYIIGDAASYDERLMAAAAGCRMPGGIHSEYLAFTSEDSAIGGPFTTFSSAGGRSPDITIGSTADDYISIV